MLTSRLPLLSLLLFFCSVTVAGQSGSAQYTIAELGEFTPRALNNSATVVGSKGNRAVLFRDGQLTDISPATAAVASANSINDLDQVVGWILICDMVGGNCVNSRTRAFVIDRGTTTILGTLGGRDSLALGINNAGHVVGFASTSFFFSEHDRAFIFSGGAMQDLNNLIPANSGWVLSRAVDINDAGQIVGNGFKNGQPKAFLLTPTQPLLITETNSTKAIVVETIWYLRDPFTLQTPVALSPDRRTRLTIVARNIEVVAGENISPLTVQAENAQHQLVNLPVEFIGKIPGASWLTQITVLLPDQLNGAGELQLRISFRGQTSNPGSIVIAASP